MLVAGFSGIGKTAVINEVHKPIVKQRGYFIQGKFDQFQRNIPFSAFVQAFRDLMGHLLSESDAQLEQWKTKIFHALGENGQVIVEVIPELERIIGKQPKLAELSGSAAQNRFNFLFQKFIQVFATKEHPLVIFVDDLQWADAASLKLMQLLMASGETGYLLLLGAYRDNEVFPAHPLMLTLEAICKSGATINTITLNPLSQSDINRLVADTLKCSLELAFPLTKLVAQKTQGNPFFATQFLKGLYEDEWIVFNGDLGSWECDLTKVQELALSDDVVEFMTTRLHKLPAETQEILKLAACIGNQFDLETLAIADDRPSEEVATALWHSLGLGLVLPLGETYKFFPAANPEEKASVDRPVEPPTSPLKTGTQKRDRISLSYKFLHDRVQQAAYSLIPETEKQATHLKIGELLLNKIAPEEQQQHIFAIVNQLNMAIELIKEVSAKEKLARLNLMAGKKARASAAYQPAYNYLQIGLQLLTEESWQEQYELVLSLYENATEVAYLNGDFENMDALAAIVQQKAKTLLDQIKVYEILIQANIAQNLLQKAIQTGLNVVSQLGVKFPESPTYEELEAVLAEVGDLLEATALDNLANLPPMTDTKQLAILRILSSIYAPSFMTAPLLCLLTVAKQVAISIEYGNTPQSAFAYGNYGVILCGLFMDIDLGYQFGNLALELLENLNFSPFKAKTLMTVNVCVKPWKEAICQTLPAFLEAYTSALEIGDIEFAGYSAVTYCYHSYAAGKELDVVAKEMATYGGQADQLKQQLALNNLSPFHQAVLNLQGKGTSDKPWVLLGDIFNEPTTLPSLQEANDRLTLFYFYVNKISLCYLFEADSEAVEAAQLGDRYLNAATASPMVAIFHFYDSLSRLAIYSQAKESEQEVLLSRVAANQEKMLLWAEKAPMNFQHKYDLVEAEKARVLGQKTEAIELYDQAIAGAKENGYLQEEALANELAAKFYLDWGKETIAEAYLQKAYYGYARWGAKAKTDDLAKCYPQFLTPILERETLSLSKSSTIAASTMGTISKTTTGMGSLLDLGTIMKAARSLSEEIELEGAIANLMKVVQENAGAQTVALMLCEEQVLTLVAQVTDSDPVSTSNPVPEMIINQVKRSRKPVLLDNASQENTYAGDVYIQQHQPRSILCLPLLDRGQLRGILYLENNHVTGAFTSDRVEVLSLLCSQAAISLENARLYQQSQTALTELKQTQLQMVQSEKMSVLGNLVAGVAHEINNPTGFLQGNIQPAQEYVQDLLGLIDLYQQQFPNPGDKIESEIEAIELEFIRSDLPSLLESMNIGVERIKTISKSLRIFSRKDTEEKTKFNLHDGINSTLLILKHRTKPNQHRPAIKIVKKYQEIPDVQCFPGQLNQVFMNILANAIDAFDEANVGKSYDEIKANTNCITIETSVLNAHQVQIQIKDNGCGMNPETKERIFEQGFTTKGVGKGTGLGMAIARQIVTEKHGGTITCHSELGKGTTFAIGLPI
jgi:predicted ATPase/signal transduction histidine kinase